MAKTFVMRRRIEFCETDAAGIAHFSAFLCYMEQAEHALWRHLGTSVIEKLEDGWHLSWPRVHAECDYSGSARFEQEIDIVVQVLKLGRKSVTYGFEFMIGDKSIATGKLVAVCCRVRSGDAFESVEIPPALAAKLRVYVAE